MAEGNIGEETVWQWSSFIWREVIERGIRFCWPRGQKSWQAEMRWRLMGIQHRRELSSSLALSIDRTVCLESWVLYQGAKWPVLRNFIGLMQILDESLDAAAAAKLLQSCPTLCNPIDGSPPGSPIPGILKARTLEWVAISFFNAWKWKVKVKSLSHVWLLATPWTVAYRAPPSMGFSRQEYWSGVPLPSPTRNSVKNHVDVPEGLFFCVAIAR